MIKKAAIFLACLLLNLTITSVAKAEEIVIEVTGNGGESSNQVQVQTQNNSTVNQNNEAQVTNNVENTANTGDNTASYNTSGETSITTGDASSTTTVNNQNINTNAAESPCNNCESNFSTTITGNGAGSYNTATQNNSQSTTANQSNYATITNNITVNANTGYNKASFNGGNSSILTGNISASTVINNRNINNSIYIGIEGSSNSQIKISGNGEGSFNNASFNNNTSYITTTINIADILNNVEHNLNTGGNETLKNLGDSAIITGDIVSTININNENINSSFVKIICECDDEVTPPIVPPVTPTDPISKLGDSYVQPSTGSSGSTGPAAGSVLPQTGITIPFTLIATLFFIFTFLLGLYLRFYSSKAPPAVARR